MRRLLWLTPLWLACSETTAPAIECRGALEVTITRRDTVVACVVAPPDTVRLPPDTVVTPPDTVRVPGDTVYPWPPGHFPKPRGPR